MHDRLHKSDYIGTEQLDEYLPNFCREIAAASCGPGRVWALIVDAAPLTISNDMAVTLALIVNELLYSQMRFNIRDRLVMAEPYRWRLASTQTSFQ